MTYFFGFFHGGVWTALLMLIIFGYGVKDAWSIMPFVIITLITGIAWGIDLLDNWDK